MKTFKITGARIDDTNSVSYIENERGIIASLSFPFDGKNNKKIKAETISDFKLLTSAQELLEALQLVKTELLKPIDKRAGVRTLISQISEAINKAL